MSISQQLPDKRGSLLELVLLGYIIVFHLWPAYAVIKVGALPGLNLQRLFILILIFCWIFTLRSSRWHYNYLIKQIAKYRFLVTIVFTYFILRYVSVSKSDNFIYSFYVATNEVISWLLLFFIGVTVWHSSRQISRVILVLIVLSIIISVIGLYESHVEKNIFEQFVPITSEYTKQALESKVRDTYRVQATFEHPLVLAQYLVFIIPLAMIMAVNSPILFYRIIGSMAVILDGLAMWKTGSRTAIVVLIGLVFLAAMWKIWLIIKQSKDYRVIALLLALFPIGIALATFGFLAINYLFQGRSSEEASSTETRIIQLDRGISLILNHPLLGYGPGNGAILVDIRGESGLPTIDNYYLSIALESGLPALLLFTFAFGYILFLSLQTYRCGFAYAGGLTLAFIGFISSLPALSITAFFPLVFLSFSLVTAMNNLSKIYDKNSKEIKI